MQICRTIFTHIYINELGKVLTDTTFGYITVIRKRQECSKKVEKVKTCIDSVTNCVRRGIFGRCRRYETECTRYEEKEIVTLC